MTWVLMSMPGCKIFLMRVFGKEKKLILNRALPKQISNWEICI